MNRENILNRQDPASQKRLHPRQGVQAGLALDKTGILSRYSSVSFFLVIYIFTMGMQYNTE
jgi:hypothetical protein